MHRLKQFSRVAITSLVLLIVLTSIAHPEIASFASAYTNPYGTISYDSGTNTLTWTGNSSDNDAWKFYDFWYWANIDPGTYPDLINSSDATATHEGTQYTFYCKLREGDGSTPTYFADENKQITIADGVSTTAGDKWCKIMNNAHMTIGEVADETNYIGTNGCSFIMLESTYATYIFYKYSSGELNFYASSIYCPNHNFHRGLFAPDRVYQYLMVHSLGIYASPSTSIVRDVTVVDGTRGIQNCQGDLSNILVKGCTVAIQIEGGASSVVKNVKATANTNTIGTYNLNADGYVIDADIDNFVISWGGTSSGKIYIQYTFNPIITYVNGSPVAYAHVILKDRYNNTIIDDCTDSDGRILNGTEPYIVTYAFYNQTGGNTPYLQGPHHLTITKAGYATYETNITIDHPVIDDAFVLDSLTYTYDDIMNYLQQKWGSYNASQFWNYINQIDANLTDVYNLLQLTDGNLTDVMNLLQSPFAQYTYDIQGCNIRFHENAFDWNGYITNYTWDFGDGNISYEQNPLHSYNSVGYYNVTLTVTDNESKSSNVTHMINVTSACPFPPLLVSPKNNSNDVDKDVLLSVYVYDPSDNPMTVTFYQYNATGNDTVIGTCNGISGQEASIIWKDRTVGQTYQWYAIASDGTHNATSGIFSFTVSETQINVPQTAFYGGLILFIGMAAIGEYAYRKSEKKTTILFALVALVSFLNVYLVWNWKWMVTFYILTTLLYSLRWAFSRVSGGEL